MRAAGSRFALRLGAAATRRLMGRRSSWRRRRRSRQPMLLRLPALGDLRRPWGETTRSTATKPRGRRSPGHEQMERRRSRCRYRATPWNSLAARRQPWADVRAEPHLGTGGALLHDHDGAHELAGGAAGHPPDTRCRALAQPMCEDFDYASFEPTTTPDVSLPQRRPLRKASTRLTSLPPARAGRGAIDKRCSATVLAAGAARLGISGRRRRRRTRCGARGRRLRRGRGGGVGGGGGGGDGGGGGGGGGAAASLTMPKCLRPGDGTSRTPRLRSRSRRSSDSRCSPGGRRRQARR